MKYLLKRQAPRLCGLLSCLFLWVGTAAAQEVPELLEPAGMNMDTATAFTGELSQIATYEASVVPRVEPLYFKVDGIVDEVLVTVGQQVRAGDVLVTLEQEEQTLQAEALAEEIDALRADAAYEDALADVDRSILALELQALMNQSPRDESAIALKRLDMDAFELEQSLNAELREMELSRLEDQWDALEAQAGLKVLRAPWDGCVMFLTGIESGSFLSAYAPVLYLADDGALSVQSELISESLLLRAHDLWAQIGDRRYEITPLPMDWSEYYSKAVAGETLYTEFSLDNPDGDVAAGAYAAVCVESGFVPDALLLPANAVYSDANGSYVYRIDGGARVRQSVEIGASNAAYVQITDGIEEGAVVYVKE